MEKRCDKRGQFKKISLCNFLTKNRKGIVTEYLPWLLIGIIILAIVMVSIFLFKGKGFEFIDKIKSIFGGR